MHLFKRREEKPLESSALAEKSLAHFRFHRIRVFDGSQPTERRYAVTRPTGQMPADSWASAASLASWFSDSRFYGFTPQTMKVLEQLLAVEGVLAVTVQDHELRIRIGAAYNFSDIHNEIASIIRFGYFEGADFDSVEIENMTASARDPERECDKQQNRQRNQGRG